MSNIQLPAVIGADDFDGDGRIDLVEVYDKNVRPGDLEIDFGRGDGTFESRRDYAAGKSVQAAAIADFDMDGRPDVAVASAGEGANVPGAVSILLGAEDGTLLPGGTLQTGRSTSSIATGDFNNDGRADLAASNRASNDISVFMGQGDGTFRGLPPFAASQNPQAILVDDFDHDGIQDLIVLAMCGDAYCRVGHILAFAGGGDGTFFLQDKLETAPTNSSWSRGT